MVEQLQIKGASWSITVDSETENQLVIPWYDYGFYHAYVNGVEVPTKSHNFFIEFDVPKGISHIVVRYEERKIYLIADAISLLGFSFLFLSCILEKNKKYTVIIE